MKHEVHSNFKQLRAMFMACLAVLFLLTGCEDDADKAVPATAVTLENSVYALFPSEEVTVKLLAEGYKGTTDVSIPFTLSGTAAEGADYSISAKNFVLKAGATSAEVTIQATDQFEIGKTIEIKLGTLPSGLIAGENTTATLGVNTKDLIIYSFEKENNLMTQTAEVALELKTVSGAAFVAEKEMRIPIVVAPTSTAIEGTHFAFKGAKEIIIPVGKSKGSLVLDYKKQETGKSNIVLTVGTLDKYYVAGNFDETQIAIFGPVAEQLLGKWKYKAFANHKWLQENIFFDPTNNFPNNNSAADILEITSEGLKVNMTGDVKKYFRDGQMEYIKEEDERLQEAGGIKPPVVKLQLVKVLANVSFSATTKNERQAEVGFRVFKDGGKDILEVTVRDYEPTDFMQESFKFYKQYGGDKPYMKSMPIRYHFERVE